MRDVRRTDGGRRLRGGPGKIVDGVFWTTPELSVSTLTSERLQPRTRGNVARTKRRYKGRNVSWRNGSLQRKSGLDYGMQQYAQT